MLLLAVCVMLRLGVICRLNEANLPPSRLVCRLKYDRRLGGGHIFSCTHTYTHRERQEEHA